METTFPEGTLFFHQKVNRNRTPIQVMKDLGWDSVEVLDREYYDTMPSVGGEEVELVFPPMKGLDTLEEVVNLLTEKGLTPDPIALFDFNRENPDFVKKHSHTTLLKNVEDGGRCHCWTFLWTMNYPLGDRMERAISCNLGWNDHWFVCGSRPINR